MMFDTALKNIQISSAVLRKMARYRTMIKHAMAEKLGWMGVATLLAGYTLASFGVISATSITCQMINLVGNIGLILVGISQKARQSVFINAIFIAICLASIAHSVIVRH